MNGRPTNLAQEDLVRIQQVLEETFAPTTRNTYGTGLFAFHLFCDAKGIDEEHRAPADPTVLASFISTLIGTYGSSTVRNYVYGVRAWHIVHGIKWSVNEHEIDALFKAAKKLEPKRTRKKAKLPWTIQHLTDICGKLLDNPKDVAIRACLTTAFWGTARLGEVTVPRLNGFDPDRHVKITNVRHDVEDRNGLKQTTIFIPWTKSAMEKGEEIFWAEQNGPTDPQRALAEHIKINNPTRDEHLFTFKHGDGRRPMTRHIFLSRIENLAHEHKLPRLQGHGIRVGSTLEYLLRGIPFEVVKAKGRWQSEAFRSYLRKHAQIMAPYIQADHDPREPFITYAMPPVR